MPLPNPADVIPHREPHLWLDGVTELEPGVSALGFWTPSEEHFAGHFPEFPLLPGVKQVEACAQLGAYVLLSGREDDVLPIFGGIQQVNFTGVVRPGDRLELNVRMREMTKRGFVGDVAARVGNRPTMDGTIFGSIVKRAVLMKLSGQ